MRFNVAFFVNYCQPAVGDLTEIDVPAANFRLALAALAGTGQDGLFAPDGAVVTHRAAGANFSVDIQPFQALVAGDDVADQGSYLITNTATYNLATPSPPGTGSRTHRLVAQVRDHRCNGSWPAGTYDWVPLVVTDGGSGLPALPASALDLCSIVIASGQANVADSNLVMRYPLLSTLARSGPWVADQSGAGSWNSTGNWVGFSGGNWPGCTFTVPPSGSVYITISGTLGGGTGYSALIGWSISGGDAVGNSDRHAIMAGDHTGRMSKRFLQTGLTPGASDTVTAAWKQNGPGGSDAGDGQIIVEAVQ
jgi:hypothetical protein